MGTAHRNLAFLAEARRNKLPDSFDRVMPALRAMVESAHRIRASLDHVCNDAHETGRARQVVHGFTNERSRLYDPTNEPMGAGSRPFF